MESINYPSFIGHYSQFIEEDNSHYLGSEEFAFILEGNPEVWINGKMYALHYIPSAMKK